jgi:hypothetical protein
VLVLGARCLVLGARCEVLGLVPPISAHPRLRVHSPHRHGYSRGLPVLFVCVWWPSLRSSYQGDGALADVELFTAIMRTSGFGGVQAGGSANMLVARTFIRRLLLSSEPLAPLHALYVLRFVEDVFETSLSRRALYVAALLS